MARKSNSLNPAMYGLTQQDVERVIRIHTMCKDMVRTHSSRWRPLRHPSIWWPA